MPHTPAAPFRHQRRRGGAASFLAARLFSRLFESASHAQPFSLFS